MSTVEGLKKQIEEYKSLIEDLRVKGQVLSNQREELDKKSEETKIQYVLQSGILAEAVWEVQRLSMSPKFTLYGKDKHFKKLCEMLQSDYHCHLEIEPGVELHFNDWDINLTFTNASKALEFITTYKLKLKLESFLEEREELKNRLNSVEKFLEQFKGLGEV